MKLRCLGGPSGHGNSPTLWATDHDTVVVQGWTVPGHDDRVEIPQRLLGFLEPGSCIGARLTDTGRGTLTLSGTPVIDREAVEQLNLPAHESAVEVPAMREETPDAVTHG
ncbi:hypothetical protein [Nocardia sp. NPDC004711]